MPSKNVEVAKRFHADIFMRDDYDAADQILAPDFVWRMPGVPDSRGNREGVKDFARSLRAAFPNYRITDHEIIHSGEKVVIRWTNDGGAQQDFFMGIAPTGAHASAEGIDIFRVAHGKIVELYQIWDQMRVMTQLGQVAPDAMRFA